MKSVGGKEPEAVSVLRSILRLGNLRGANKDTRVTQQCLKTRLKENHQSVKSKKKKHIAEVEIVNNCNSGSFFFCLILSCFVRND